MKDYMSINKGYCYCKEIPENAFKIGEESKEIQDPTKLYRACSMYCREYIKNIQEEAQ